MPVMGEEDQGSQCGWSGVGGEREEERECVCWGWW